VKGLAVLDPDRFRINPVPPPVIIEEALVDEVVEPLERSAKGLHLSQAGLSAQPGQASTRLRVGPGKQRFEFRFTGLSLTSSQKVRFKYKLEGLESKWTEAGTRRVANYGYLAPGAYRFRVTACNNDGIWSEEGDALALTILPYFWQTGWFRIATAGLLMAATALVAQQVSTRRLQLKLRRAEQERALERERTRIARDIHDSLGAGLTRVALMSDLARRGHRPAEEIRERLDAIHRDARDLTRSVDEIVWAVNPRNDTADRFISYVVHDVEQFVRAGDLTLRLDVPDRLPDDLPLTAQVRHHVCLAVRELLQNVLRHAHASHIDFSITLAENQLSVTVADDGVGLCGHADPAIGQDGLVNVADRIAEVGGTVAFDAPGRAGTRAVISVPLTERSAAVHGMARPVS